MACLLADAHHLSDVEIENDNRSTTLLSVFETVLPWEVAVILKNIKIFVGSLVIYCHVGLQVKKFSGKLGGKGCSQGLFRT
ncbi:hypothetical protein ACSBR2_034491 [Camellia fascicularis]